MNTAGLLSTVNARATTIDLSGFATAGIWVRRVRSIPTLGEEAISLAAVMQTWNLADEMAMETYDGVYAEISGPDLQPTWVYMIELIGSRARRRRLCRNHPLCGLQRDEPVRLVAIVSDADFAVIGVMVETQEGQCRRMLWLQAAVAQ